MLVEAFHFVTSRSEIFAGVEFARFVMEYLADSSCHGKTAVRVKVEFANGALGSFSELFFRDTDSIGKLASEFVDDVNIFLGN